MHRYLTSIKKPDEEFTANCSVNCILKSNSCKFGVTSVIIDSEERNECVLHLSISTADNMKSKKLKQHLETKHSEIKDKPKKHFRRKLDEITSSKIVLLILLLCRPKPSWHTEQEAAHDHGNCDTPCCDRHGHKQCSVANVLSTGSRLKRTAY
jgi:hypothetical protein